MIKYILWGVFLVVTTQHSFAQKKIISWEYNFDHFGIENGIPSSETYQVYQDRSGLLWILTDRGVVRYDGFEFHTYTTDDGLSDNVNFKVQEDPNGALWFVGYNGLLTVFRNGKMQAYKYNEELEKISPFGKTPDVSFHVNADNSIVYGVTYKKVITISSKGKVSVISPDTYDYVCLFKFGEDYLSYKKRGKTRLLDTYLFQKGKKFYAGKFRPISVIRLKDHKGHLFMVCENRFYLNTNQQFKLIPESKEVIGINSDKQFLYTGLYKNGLKKYRFNPKTKKLTLVEHYLPNYSVSSAYKDENGTLWITTLENGLFAIYDESFKQLAINGTSLKQEVRFISGNRNKIILTHHIGKWQQLYPPFLCKDIGEMVYKYNLLPIKDGFGFQQGVTDWSDWKDVDATYPMNPLYETDSSVIGFSQNGVVLNEIAPKSTYSLVLESLYYRGIDGNVSLNYLLPKKKLFALRNEGLLVIKIDGNKLLGKTLRVLEKRIEGLKYNKKWGLIVFSRSGKFYRINIEKDKLERIDVDADMGKQVTKMFFDEKDRLWAVSSKGIFLLNKHKGKAKLLSFINKNLLSSAEVTDLYSYDDVLYLTTKFGVQRINFLKIKKEAEKCPLRLYSIRSFAKNKELDAKNTYPAKTDLIKISLSNRSLNNQIVYRYRFGKDQTWIKSLKGEIIVNNPSDGEFNLEVSYLNRANQWSASKILVTFTVEKVIFLRWYFITLYIALLGVLFYIVLKYTVKSVNRKNQLLNRMMELERMALAAQMNPHFIFNSLNSIHSFLLYEENENAEKYLLRFAKLIRQTLANSRVTYITIEEEYETLKNYILLESMRFKNAFTYKIECDFNKLPLNPCIPPMLIQPYVENAIIHGLPRREEGAELFIRFYKEDDVLKVLIQDNGIGYKASKRNKRDTGHKSYGTQITEERLKSFQEKSKDGFNVYIGDVDESNQEFPGTKVILTIPLPNN